jgi:FtsP/CotA-like multicopper oxidase with cupredoxin domain
MTTECVESEGALRRRRRRSRPAVGLASGAAVLLLLAGAALAATSLRAPAPKRPDCARRFPPVIHDGFPEPPMLFSHNGVLNTTLRASVSPVKIAGHRLVTMNYNGLYPAPTLVFCPGDSVTIHLINDLPQDTNLHVHGLHVSPNANHDNVFLNLRPGRRFTYQYSIPQDQDPGFFWFHPHRHELVEDQLYAGMAGGIVVEGGLDNRLANIPQRIMVIQNTELCDSTGNSVPFGWSGSQPCSTPGRTVPASEAYIKYSPYLVNGAINPVLHIRPGQLQRWRIVNANADAIVKLTLAYQPVEVLAQDGNTLRRMRPAKVILISPGSRREILVRGARRGRYTMTALPFAQYQGAKPRTQTLLTVVSGGRRAADKPPTGPLSSPLDLRRMHVDRYRQIVFHEVVPPSGKTQYLVNGHLFDPNYVPITMKLNSVEQWTIVNTDSEWHTFHIHQNPFQVISLNGRPPGYVSYEDTVGIPAFSRVVIRMRPTDFTGKFVFHCHMVFHEDNGMMMAVRVVRQPTHSQLQASTGAVHGIAVSSSSYGGRGLPGLPEAIVLFCHLLGVQLPSGLQPASGLTWSAA